MTSAWDGKYVHVTKQLEDGVNSIIDNCKELEKCYTILKEYLQSTDEENILPAIESKLDLIAEDADQLATKNYHIMRKVKRVSNFVSQEGVD